MNKVKGMLKLVQIKIKSRKVKHVKFRYMGHFCGALAGFLVGIVILENRRVEMWEVKLKVVSICIYIVLLLGAVLWHLVSKF